MEGIFIFVIIAIIVVSVIVLISFVSKKAVVRRKLRKTPSKKISDLKNGDIAKTVGRVDCINKPLIAPLTNRKCAYYFVKVEKKVSSGKSSSWRQIIKEEVTENFLIKDDTGTAIVNVDNIKSYLIVDAKYSSGFLDDAPEHLEQYLKKHGHESVGFMGFNKTIRYREAVLEIGEQIAVVGKAHTKTEDENNTIMEIKEYDGYPVYLSDDPTTLDFIEEKKDKVEKNSGFHQFDKPKKQKKEKKRSRYNKEYR
jgi:hypothetical protein